MSILILNFIALILVSLIFVGSTFVFTYLEELVEKTGAAYPSALTFIAIAELLFIFYLLMRFKAYLAGAIVIIFPTLAIFGVKTLSVANRDFVQSDES